MNPGNVTAPESAQTGLPSSALMEDIAYAIDLSFSALSNRDTASGGQSDSREALNIYCQALDDIATAAAASNALGLHEICNLLAGQVQDFRHLERSLTQAEFAFLVEWPLHLVTYLADPGDPSSCTALVRHLQDDHWPSPLPADLGDSLIALLLHPHTAHSTVQPASAAESGGEVPEKETPPPAVTLPATAAVKDEPFTAQEQMVSEALLALLMGELGEIHEDMEKLLNAAVSPEQPAEEKQQSLAQYAEQLERLGMAAEAVGLPMLKVYLASLQRRISNVAAGMSLQQYDALALLPGAILAYLMVPNDPSSAEGLIDLLRGDTWPSPPDPAYLNSLSRALSMVVLTKDAVAEPRQTKASAEDVLLTIPNDLSRELLDGLLQELPLHTAEFSSAIQRIASGQGTLADIDVAKRAAHTLKGAANTVGIKGIANLTHHVEDILVALSKDETLPNRPLAEMLTNAGDCLEAMGEAVMGTGPEPGEALATLQEVLDWANRIDQEGIPSGDPVTDSVPHAADELSAPADQNESGAAASTAAQQTEAMVRVPANLIDELLRLMGETIISTGQVRERSRRLVDRNQSVQQQNRVFLQLAMELEDLVELRGSAGDIGMARKDNEFDPLEFEHYSELHTISRRLIEAATDSGELTGEVEKELSDLNELIEVQNRLHSQSQNTVMRTRMVPVSTVISRLQRSVRQTSRLLDKNVSLHVSGADTMIDSNILNELVDPLMHILRNAVDHGIESPEQRRITGKSEEGRIELAFLREGNQVVVRCRDDGTGLDLAAIRHTAEEKGLLSPGQNPSDEELARLILAPGFSTRSESTQISGRGIGMDVVHSRVLQLKGGVHLAHAPGKGLEIELRLPATLLSTHALIIRSRDQKFAISSYGLQDIHYVTQEQVQQIGGERFIRLGENIYPLLHLDSLLHLTGNRRSEGRQEGFPALLVRLDSGTIRAVQVQEIIDSRELVVKGLGRYVPKTQGVVGATILGDGSVAAVIDVPELMRKPISTHSGLDSADSSIKRSDSALARSHLTALVVDDSLSARRATAQFMKDAGFEVRTAIDGLEAIAILDKWKPDILLVDMEMPRMNGLELTAHIRAREATAHMPVIMITSRSTEKHRTQAAAAGVNVYLTKPFGEEELLHHITELTAA